MKIQITAVLVFFTCLTNAQENYVKIDPSGYHLGENQSVVIEIPGKNANQLFNALLDFINKTYSTPDEVIKAKTENSYLRFRFFDPNMAQMKSMGVNFVIGGYTQLEIDIKDNKIRILEFIPELYFNASNITSRSPFAIKGGIMDNSLYDKDGKPRKIMVKQNVKGQLEDYYNSLIFRITNWLKQEKSNDW